MPDPKTFPPSGADEALLARLNASGQAHYRHLVAALGEPRELTLCAWCVGLEREWALCAKPSILSAGGLPLDYEVSRRSTVDEFPARLPEPGIALAALADALDLGDDLANLRFEGEDDEWRMELGRFRVAGKPAAFAVVASW